MKIMFNIQTLSKGGAERVVSVLANEFVKQNDISIMLNSNKDQAYDLDERIRLLEIDKNQVSIALFRKIKKIYMTLKSIREEKPDIIISFLPIPSYRILLLKRFIKVPIIVSDRADPNEEYRVFWKNYLILTK